MSAPFWHPVPRRVDERMFITIGLGLLPCGGTGVWFIHCHLEVDVAWGLAGAFIVENGPTPATSMIPPKCSH
ncbi:hypothetical protein LIER_05806 [Lithospermum erythrorhizon]|uniref:Plastocyanin-like domain-containing protein n=1 Tax=Lithospermum erythrorhizon TaxID=34254 RepID=A0AAV3P244_LITER